MIVAVFSPKQIERETTRPARLPLNQFAFLDIFGHPLAGLDG
jgi:hypothetical protein